jgi:succinate dehydrogenase / fumarate reductase membrane anchor subunit
MVTQVSSWSKNGVQDWILQRLSAVFLGVYVVVVVGFMMCSAPLSYETWVGFMRSTPMKIFNILAFLSVVVHAWVGLWTVITDYIKPFCARAAAQIFVVVVLLASFIWAVVALLGV